ncbi:hypothetical protein T4C_7766 [Trichinella pseudospiralis]|uniref:Uncharacterized protein n=1 Tax=Trichinella pseudospiralis TaxID=6337 RepID=A0A0V1J3J9_TRIPS|nr:hypothetical protein T4C_7766 [Trichinella pseudospiralis]
MKKKEEKWRKLSALQSWIGWIESFVGQLRSLVSCVCWSNCGTLEKIRFTEVECERFFITKTQ